MKAEKTQVQVSARVSAASEKEESVKAQDLPFSSFPDEDGLDSGSDSDSTGDANEDDARARGPSRVQRTTLGDLDWSTVPTSASFLDGEGGMLMLEEVEDVDVVWETDVNGGKKAILKKVKASEKGTKESKDKKQQQKQKVEHPVSITANGNDVGKGKGKESPVDESQSDLEEDVEMEDASEDVDEQNEEDSEEEKVDAAEAEEDIKFDDSLLPSWTGIPLHPLLKRGLHRLGYSTPTEIQKRAIPVGIQDERDVVGVAETGSGKTLAYSLPILHEILTAGRGQKINSKATKRELSALILCPTRELALQVSKHINNLMEAAVSEEVGEVASGKGQQKKRKRGDDEPKSKAVTLKKPSGPPRISVASIVGGLSALKQKRLIQRGCDVLVATPGRLWDMIQDDESLAIEIKRVKFLVIDEADRMIENGHFAEMENIAALTARQEDASAAADVEEDSIFARSSRKIDTIQPRDDLQTFIFSATLSKGLQSNLKKRASTRAPKKGAKKTSTLDDLIEMLDFRDEQPELIDLSPEGGLVKSIREAIIECVTSDKDLYLYYFLLRYPGRSLVFVGSIDGIRRLTPLFEILKVPVFPLHSQLQQKQRLKNLDRFSSSPNGVLIATDVAARGLDIPSVEHVVHFQLPRSADAYIHRSGRTARAKADGFSLQMCSPEERGMQMRLMKSLDRSPDLPELQVEPGFMPKLKERIRIAKEIEKARHMVKKKSHERNWLIEAAEAMDVDLDSDLL